MGTIWVDDADLVMEPGVLWVGVWVCGTGVVAGEEGRLADDSDGIGVLASAVCSTVKNMIYQ